MESKRVLGCVVGLIAALSASIASADTVYRGQRVDSQTGKRSFDVTIFAGEQGTRVDVSAEQQPRVSMIELSNRLILIDFAKGVYVVRELALEDASPAFVPSWLPTTRKQFALGAFCNVFTAQLSDARSEERCAFESERMLPTHAATRVGEFLGLIAASGDTETLFELSTSATMPNAMPELSFPLIIHHFEQGKMMGELRVLSVSDDVLSRGIFGIPRGLRRVAASGENSIQAAR